MNDLLHAFIVVALCSLCFAIGCMVRRWDRQSEAETKLTELQGEHLHVTGHWFDSQASRVRLEAEIDQGLAHIANLERELDSCRIGSAFRKVVPMRGHDLVPVYEQGEVP